MTYLFVWLSDLLPFFQSPHEFPSNFFYRSFFLGLSRSAHSILGLKKGQWQTPWSLHPIVTIKSESIAIFAIISFGLLRERSMPFSFITSTTMGRSLRLACYRVRNNKIISFVFFSQCFSYLAHLYRQTKLSSN